MTVVAARAIERPKPGVLGEDRAALRAAALALLAMASTAAFVVIHVALTRHLSTATNPALGNGTGPPAAVGAVMRDVVENSAGRFSAALLIATALGLARRRAAAIAVPVLIAVAPM